MPAKKKEGAGTFSSTDVVGAARRKRDDPVHRPRRIGLRRRDAGDCRQRGSARGQMQKCAAWKFHFEPPSLVSLFDHLVGAGEQRRRHFEAERFGGFEIDGQVDFRGLLHGKVGWLLTLKNAIDLAGGTPVLIHDIGAVGDQPAIGDDVWRHLLSVGTCSPVMTCKANAGRTRLFRTFRLRFAGRFLSSSRRMELR
jgi:hypothetical protein